MERPFIEISRQVFTAAEAQDGELSQPAGSWPLHDLQDVAPPIGEAPKSTASFKFPFANDESAVYFRQIAARTDTPEYRAATNRTALLIGESSLIAALPYLPEDTILLIDKRPEFCFYMRQYVDALRAAPDMQTWHLEMARRLDPSYDSDLGELNARQLMGPEFRRQIKQWHEAGMPHGLADADAYEQARRLAHEKAIVPWQADIQSEDDMRQLADVLTERAATITMANLTNAINWPYLSRHDPSPVLLEKLPITEHAPILTTSPLALPRGFSEELRKQDNPKTATYLVPATGPFFGLRNLFAEGGTGTVGGRDAKLGKAVFRRQYVSPDSGEAG